MRHICDLDTERTCDRIGGFSQCNGRWAEESGMCEIYVPPGAFPRPTPKPQRLTDEEREDMAIRNSPDYARAMVHDGSDIW